jgi:hypothetical protein
MFQFYRDFSEEFMAVRDLGFAKELNPELLDFDGWLAKYAAKIPITA